MSMPWNFNPLPPCGGRLCNRVFPALYHYFNPLPPCGGRHGLPPLGFSDFPISIHSLRVEGDSGGVPEGLSAVISIHSLRVEGDLHQGNQSRPGAISIHSLRVEGDAASVVVKQLDSQFQSTPSVWRETLPLCVSGFCILISIHSLRVEGDSVLERGDEKMSISIHSLRVEGDRPDCSSAPRQQYFNPLPPCGGRHFCGILYISHKNFNPLPPCGGRPMESMRHDDAMNFNPLPPCGGRLCDVRPHDEEGYFNPLPPCGGRLCPPCCFSLSKFDFNPLPPCGGRRGDHPGGAVRGDISIHSLRVEGDCV